MFARLLHRLRGTAQPDGAAPALEDQALTAGQLAIAARPLPPVNRPRDVIVAALGQKVLHSWLQNRHQTRFPLVLNLRNNSPDEKALILAIVRTGLELVGAGETAIRQAADFVEGIGGTLDPGPPEPRADLILRLDAARLTAEAYAASAGALGRRTLETRRYLDFLAARLDIPDEVARSINRRFAS